MIACVQGPLLKNIGERNFFVLKMFKNVDMKIFWSIDLFYNVHCSQVMSYWCQKCQKNWGGTNFVSKIKCVACIIQHSLQRLLNPGKTLAMAIWPIIAHFIT